LYSECFEKKRLLYHHCHLTLLKNTLSERTKPQGIENQWGTSASGLFWLLIDWAKICYKNTEALLIARKETGLETYIYSCPMKRMQDKSQPH
jgi:hypothetical protein